MFGRLESRHFVFVLVAGDSTVGVVRAGAGARVVEIRVDFGRCGKRLEE